MRKLKTTSAFRTDLKKLSKAEADETKSVVLKLQKDKLQMPNIATTICTEITMDTVNAISVQIFFLFTPKEVKANYLF